MRYPYPCARNLHGFVDVYERRENWLVSPLSTSTVDRSLANLQIVSVTERRVVSFNRIVDEWASCDTSTACSSLNDVLLNVLVKGWYSRNKPVSSSFLIGWAKRVQHPASLGWWDSKRIRHPSCRSSVPLYSTNTPFDKFALQTYAARCISLAGYTHILPREPCIIVFAMRRRSENGEYR